MYGLVNQAFEDMALQLGGHELWLKIVERAGHDVPVFVAMETYDDGDHVLACRIRERGARLVS